MLRLQILATFSLLVSVTFPSNDPRKPNTGTFTARYKDMDRKALRDLGRDHEQGTLTDDELLDRILDEGDAIGQIGDAEGNLLPVEEQRALVYNRLPLAKATISAFFDQVGGVQGKTSLLSRVR